MSVLELGTKNFILQNLAYNWLKGNITKLVDEIHNAFASVSRDLKPIPVNSSLHEMKWKNGLPTLKYPKP